MRLLIPFCFTILLFVTACNSFNTDRPENVIAEYNGQYLSLDQVKNEFENCKTESDTTERIEVIKSQWLKYQLIIEKAEKELPSTEINIDLDLLQYKADLLRYKFDNFYINNKINTSVSQQEIEEFYDNNQSILKSNKTLVKAVYIEIDKAVKDKYKAKQWLASNREKDQERLKIYCFQNAEVFDDFEDSWVELDKLQAMSRSNQLVASKIKKNKVSEYHSDKTTYYILFTDIINKGQLAPLEYVKPEIAEMIINNRRRDLRSELDSKLDEQVAKLK
jgi:hypothetical protein